MKNNDFGKVYKQRVDGMDQHGISKLDLKRQNRMQVLKILKQRGPTSRIDIASTLELTRAAVTIITNEMIEQGIITEIGEFKHSSERAPRGRKKILIDINHNYKFVVGVIVEEDIVSIGLSTLAGAVLDKRNLIISGETAYEKILEFINNSLKEIMDYNCLKLDSILGIGIGVMPTMYSRMGIQVENRVSDYTQLTKAFEKFTNLPIVIDNSVKGTAMANIDFQKVKDPNRYNIAFLQYGDNFNFVVTNLNDPIVSYDNRTNFVDNIIVNPNSDEECPCGRRGCAKSELSPAALIKKAKRVFDKEKAPYLYAITDGNPDNIVYEMIMDSVANGDPAIKEMYRRSAELMAVLMNNLIFSTNPQKLVMHDFRISDSDFYTFKSIMERIGGKDISELIELSIIEEKHRFLAGAAIAIRELFFTRGGYDLLDT